MAPKTKEILASITKLVLESSSPGIKNEKDKTIRLKKDQELAQSLQNGSLKKILESWYNQSIFHGIKHHPNYNQMITRKLSNDPKLLEKALTAYSVGNQSYLAKKLSALKIPVHLICGEKDLKYLRIMKDLKQENPNFKLTILNHCGHNIHFEKPILFAEHLTEYLSL